MLDGEIPPAELELVTETVATQYNYPWSTQMGDDEVTYRLMSSDDEAAILAFTDDLPEHDLLFLRVDITQPDAVREWIRNIEHGRTRTILAECGGRIAAYGSLHYNDILWTRHIGEIRLMVSTGFRGLGLGRRLAEQVFVAAQEFALHKVTAQMMSTQRDAQDLFHQLGFIPEALLHDWVIDRNGRTHDLILMSREVEDQG